MKDEYPKQMRHPNFTPAVLSDDNAAGRFRDAPPGRPAQFPPVTVSNADQEEYHAAKGYIPSNGKAHPTPPAPSRHKERENIRMRSTPEQETSETYEYPKWVGDKIAHSAEEERDILAIESMRDAGDRFMLTKTEPLPDFAGIDPAELAEFRAWKANRERVARGATRNGPVKRRQKPLSEAQKQVRRDNLAKARAARGARHG